jgi:hypothetical protein
LLALAACALWPSGASAAQSVKLHVGFDPNRAGVRTTIQLSLRISGAEGSLPAPVTSLDFRLPGNMGIATTTLGQANCIPGDLISGGLSGCSANARIGFGNATAVIPVGSHLVREKASLNALMGPPVKDQLEVLFYVEALQPVLAQLVLPSLIRESSAPYGEELDTSVPLVPAWTEGPDLSLETFNSTIGPLHLIYFREVNGRTVPYYPHGIRVPLRCPRGGYPFQAALTFADGTRGSTVYRVPCPAA